MKNLKKILIPIIVILVALAIAEGLYYFTKARGKSLSLDKATERVTNYINNTLLEGSANISVIETAKQSGVYLIKFELENEEYTSYVTKDGKLLFPQVIEIPDEVSESTTPTDFGISKRDVPMAQLFVMSFCPYGNQAEEIMMEVVDLLQDKADIELHYVIYSNYQGGGSNYCLDKESKYCSMHGVQELNQDIRELCVQKYQKDKLWDFLKEINSNCSAQNVDSCWEGVARTMGLDVGDIKNCQKEEALAMAEEELQLNKKYGITGSPQLIINDIEYQGARNAEAYKTAICSGFNNPPEECSQTLSGGTSTPSGGCE